MMELFLNGFNFLMMDGKKLGKLFCIYTVELIICVVEVLIVILQARLPKKQTQEFLVIKKRFQLILIFCLTKITYIYSNRLPTCTSKSISCWITGCIGCLFVSLKS